MSRSYLEMIEYPSFEERLQYLMLSGSVGYETFGYDRWVNQALYSSSEWREFRHRVIVRDGGCDLGVEGYEIQRRPLIHHKSNYQRDGTKPRSNDIRHEQRCDNNSSNT